MTLDILHDASGVLAIAKPAGLPTQAPPGIESVESVVRERLFGTTADSERTAARRRHPGGFLGVPHRLDRAVSGVLLLATTPRAARQLSRQFERRQITKTYLAVVSRPLEAPANHTPFEWRDMIRKVPDEPRAEIVAPGTTDAREAVTTGRVLAADGDRLLLALHPLTGRMHQLRVQAAARAMPVLGDSLYGGLADSDGRDPRSRPVALHAWRIRFADPESGHATEVVCPCPSGPPWDTWPDEPADPSWITW